MTYLALLLVCLLPPIGVLLRYAGTRNSRPHAGDLHQLAALAALIMLAVLGTLPWDAALIARGTWSYPQAQPVGWVAGVPVEELLFMVLQPLLAGLWLRTRPTSPARPEVRRGQTRRVGAVLWVIIAGLGALLSRSASGSYLGLLLAWAGPLLALQWAVAGDALWAQRRLLIRGVLPPMLYLWAVDRLGLHLHLWQLSAARTTGLQLLGLPVEEAVFFALTTLLVVGGLLLATDQQTLAQLRAWLPRRPPSAACLVPHAAAVRGSGSTARWCEVTGTVQVADWQDAGYGGRARTTRRYPGTAAGPVHLPAAATPGPRRADGSAGTPRRRQEFR